MTKHLRHSAAALAALALALAGCGDDAAEEPGADVDVEVPEEPEVDVEEPEAEVEEPEAEVEEPMEGETDTGADTGADAGADAGTTG